jgi:hypothetical protein
MAQQEVLRLNYQSMGLKHQNMGLKDMSKYAFEEVAAAVSTALHASDILKVANEDVLTHGKLVEFAIQVQAALHTQNLALKAVRRKGKKK